MLTCCFYKGFLSLNVIDAASSAVICFPFLQLSLKLCNHQRGRSHFVARLCDLLHHSTLDMIHLSCWLLWQRLFSWYFVFSALSTRLLLIPIPTQDVLTSLKHKSDFWPLIYCYFFPIFSLNLPETVKHLTEWLFLRSVYDTGNNKRVEL